MSDDKMRTVPLAKALEGMRGGFGPPARVGWAAALDDNGRVVMVAGKPALHVLMQNANAQGYRVVKIVRGAS